MVPVRVIFFLFIESLSVRYRSMRFIQSSYLLRFFFFFFLLFPRPISMIPIHPPPPPHPPPSCVCVCNVVTFLDDWWGKVPSDFPLGCSILFFYPSSPVFCFFFLKDVNNVNALLSSTCLITFPSLRSIRLENYFLLSFPLINLSFSFSQMFFSPGESLLVLKRPRVSSLLVCE